MSSHNEPPSQEQGQPTSAGEPTAAAPSQQQQQQDPQQEQDSNMFGMNPGFLQGAGRQGFGGLGAGFTVDHFSRFVADPTGFLASTEKQKPSLAALGKLSGQVANHIRQLCAGAQTDPNEAQKIIFLYLRAASKHLMAGTSGQQSVYQPNKQNDVLTAINSVAQCMDAALISQSGIISSLAYCVASLRNHIDVPLKLAHVVFLQSCIRTSQFRFAEHITGDDWPRPESSSGGAEQVIRYYLLRGTIHIECEHWNLAHRCFWTCLSIPGDSRSPDAVEAWKKLILVQCIRYEEDKLNRGGPSAPEDISSRSTKPVSGLSVPQSMPDCLVQLLNSYRNPQIAVRGPGKQATRSSNRHGRPNQGRRIDHLEAIESMTSSDGNPIAPYMDIAKAFFSNDRGPLERLVHQHAQSLSGDGNMGLIEQIIVRMLYCKVAHVACVYSVLSLTKLCRLLGVDESSINPVLCKSRVPFEIQDDGMVVFPDFALHSPNSLHDDQSATLSFESLKSWSALMDRMQNLDAGLALTPAYQSVARKDSSSSKSGGPRGVNDI